MDNSSRKVHFIIYTVKKFWRERAHSRFLGDRIPGETGEISKKLNLRYRVTARERHGIRKHYPLAMKVFLPSPLRPPELENKCFLVVFAIPFDRSLVSLTGCSSLWDDFRTPTHREFTSLTGWQLLCVVTGVAAGILALTRLYMALLTSPVVPGWRGLAPRSRGLYPCMNQLSCLAVTCGLQYLLSTKNETTNEYLQEHNVWKISALTIEAAYVAKKLRILLPCRLVTPD
eukprot:6209158-Pleurochrysis_carterae.AAC.2